MDISVPDCRSGNKCAFLAALGNPGRDRSAVCVAFMLVPFGLRTLIPFAVGVMFSHGMLMCKKLSVLPESIIAKFCCILGRCKRDK